MNAEREPPTRAAKGGKTLVLIGRIRESVLPPTQRLVLLMLASRIGWTNRKGRPGGTCDPAVKQIAKDTGLCARAVNTAIRALVDSRWLVIEPRTKDGMDTSNRYRITPPKT